jgi:hypothetical protein
MAMIFRPEISRTCSPGHQNRAKLPMPARPRADSATRPRISHERVADGRCAPHGFGAVKERVPVLRRGADRVAIDRRERQRVGGHPLPWSWKPGDCDPPRPDLHRAP